jgi:hypothetical protein
MRASTLSWIRVNRRLSRGGFIGLCPGEGGFGGGGAVGNGEDGVAVLVKHQEGDGEVALEVDGGKGVEAGAVEKVAVADFPSARVEVEIAWDFVVAEVPDVNLSFSLSYNAMQQKLAVFVPM